MDFQPLINVFDLIIFHSFCNYPFDEELVDDFVPEVPLESVGTDSDVLDFSTIVTFFFKTWKIEKFAANFSKAFKAIF